MKRIRSGLLLMLLLVLLLSGSPSFAVNAYGQGQLSPDRIGLNENPLLEYKDLLQTRIGAAISYPELAADRRLKPEGMVNLGLFLLSNGRLERAIVIKSSGNIKLDEAAVMAVRAGSPYPPFPPEIEAEKLWIEIPIIYKEAKVGEEILKALRKTERGIKREQKNRQKELTALQPPRERERRRLEKIAEVKKEIKRIFKEIKRYYRQKESTY